MSMETTETPLSSGSTKETFYRNFQQDRTTLQQHLTHLKDLTTPAPERATLTSQCQSKLSQLSDLLKDASTSLPAHDQRTYSTAITTLRDELQEARTAALPKRKFAFKKTTASVESATPANDGLYGPSLRDQEARRYGQSAESSAQTVAAPKKQPQFPNSSSILAVTVSSLSHAHYILPLSSVQPASSVSITDCHHSVIDLSITTTPSLAFASMTFKSVLESLLLCGKVTGPVHITGVERSTLVISSRQVRMHDCKDCVVYLRCSSRPIIEDCEGIRFAPLPSTFDIDENYLPNLWDQVDDFKWLRAEHSPNWSTLSHEDVRAVANEAWGMIVAGKGQTLEVNKLLRTAKIIT